MQEGQHGWRYEGRLAGCQQDDSKHLIAWVVDIAAQGRRMRQWASYWDLQFG